MDIHIDITYSGDINPSALSLLSNTRIVLFSKFGFYIYLYVGMCLTGMPSTSLITESDCGVLNSKLKYESEACNKQLPYICKKSISTSHTNKTGGSSAPSPCCLL